MKPKVLTEKQIKEFLASLVRRSHVLAPTLRDGVPTFEWLRDPCDFQRVRGGIPLVSPKKGLLPRSEVLFYYRAGKARDTIATPPPPQPQVLFGLHPCDLQAIRVLDTVFEAPPHPDEPYLSRRKVTSIVGWGCPPEESAPQAFFEQLGISSMDNSNCDLFLSPIGADRLVLETLTDKGKALAKELPSVSNATEGDLRSLRKLRKAAGERVTQTYSSEDFFAAVERQFDSPIWDRIGETCAACGACAFLCPTCHCFDIQDENLGTTGRRIRLWDTCQFEQFTRHASGHNPRTEKPKRSRQRIYHKFEYGRKNFGMSFCVGCGRCVLACPMHGNLADILETLRNAPAGAPVQDTDA